MIASENQHYRGPKKARNIWPQSAMAGSKEMYIRVEIVGDHKMALQRLEAQLLGELVKLNLQGERLTDGQWKDLCTACNLTPKAAQGKGRHSKIYQLDTEAIQYQTGVGGGDE